MSSPETAEVQKPKLTHLKWVYSVDPKGQGFYWPSSDQKRSEIMAVSRNAPHEFAAVYQCNPGGRIGTVFLDSDISNFYTAPPSLVAGLLSDSVSQFIRRGHGVYQAWDTAFSQSAQSAWTVCVTALFVSCDKYHCNEDPALVGPCDTHMDVYILDVMRGKIDWGGLVNALKTQYQKWAPDGIIIEKRASGISLIQALSRTTLPIIPVVSNDSKGGRALNTVGLKTAGSVQGWFRQHRVSLPDPAPEWHAKWRAEMKDFSGQDDAASDQVDATVHLVSHAITMGSSMAVLPSDWSPDPSKRPANSPENALFTPDSTDPRVAFLSYLGQLPSLTIDPFEGMCARCVNYSKGFCSFHNHSTLSMDSCEEFTDVSDAARDKAQRLEGDLSSIRH